MSKPRSLPGVIALAGLLFALPALADSWQWRDAAGRMVYSDLPPPAEVRAAQILRSPTHRTDANAPAAPAAAPNWVEKEQASRKRAAEREESQRKQREESEQIAQSARACDDARTALRTLESGSRMAVLNQRGEREVLDDAERARRIDSVRKEIARGCAKGG